MNIHRTVAWLAVFMIITPFLAVPDWLVQVVISILGLAVISSVWLGQSKKDTVSTSNMSNSFRADEEGETRDNNSDGSAEKGRKPKDPELQQDIEDPEADTMVAAVRWRRRASRDIS
jgi:hypothetical protein